MNIELKPIAESKVRQVGGDVCGVLVRTDGGVMAVSEHGRCTRLDAGVMGPVEPSGASDYTKLPRNIADCMSRAGSPLSEDQKLLLAGYLAPVQQRLSDCEARVAELEDKNAKFAVALKEKMILTEGAYVLRKQEGE